MCDDESVTTKTAEMSYITFYNLLRSRLTCNESVLCVNDDDDDCE